MNAYYTSMKIPYKAWEPVGHDPAGKILQICTKLHITHRDQQESLRTHEITLEFIVCPIRIHRRYKS